MNAPGSRPTSSAGTTSSNSATASGSSQIWNGNGTTSNLTNGTNSTTTTITSIAPAGLQLPTKSLVGSLAAGVSTPLKGSAPSTPARQGSIDPEGPRTDVDSLMDAVGASGVDIDAEEEAMRLANERVHQNSIPSGPVVDRSRKQDFIDPNVLAECVKRVAAAFALRTLEPDTIPLIALATRHRLMAIINSAIETRDHRVHSSHLRLPPLTASHKRSRSISTDDDSDFDEEEEEGERRRRKGKGKEVLEANWDQIIYDDQEKILTALEKVEREEERKKRRERMLRDQKEQEEKDLEEAIKASEAANAELGNLGGSALDNLVMGSSMATPGSGASTPRGKGENKETKAAAKKEKKKKDNPANLSEVVKKKMTDQVAMRSIGGRTFNWATGGGSGFSSPTPGGMSTPGTLPKPKFPNGLTSLPAPNFGTPLSKTPFNSSNLASTSINGNNPLARLSNVPLLHEANRSEIERAEWERGKSVVELGDIVFALERERGMGVGKGSGRNVLVKSRAGLKGIIKP